MHLFDRFNKPLEDGDVVEFVHAGQMIYGQVWGMFRESNKRYPKGECNVIIEYRDKGPLKKIGTYSNRDITKVPNEKALLWKLENA